MKRLSILIVVVLSIFLLTGCSFIEANDGTQVRYCIEYPEDASCSPELDPHDEDLVCLDGWEYKDGLCIKIVEPVDTVTCNEGYHVEDGQCIPDVTDPVCDSDLILDNGNCVATCDVAITNPNYYPCFRECNPEFPCTYHKLVLSEENSYFESFVMWVKKTNMNNSTEFELHYILKDETEINVAVGGDFLWCNPNITGCEDLFKAHFTTTQNTGDIKLKFEFWYDEDWYTEVHYVWKEVWNEEKEEFEYIDLNIGVFYLEDAHE